MNTDIQNINVNVQNNQEEDLTEQINNINSDCGFIYIASNDVGGVDSIDYIKEAIFSAQSLKKQIPNANITLFTDKKINCKDFNNIILCKMGLRCKQKYFLQSPYEKTIYIDTDTYINYDISDMFKMLTKYELLCVHDYARKRRLGIPEYDDIPYGFSELNGGIIGFKKCENLKILINKWNKYYEKYYDKIKWDQPSFRIAVWKSNINLYCLPIEYNRRSKDTKQKCIDLKNKGDPRFGKSHLVTRIYHFHGLSKLNIKQMEEKAQNF